MSRLISAIKPTFSIETGKTEAIGPQPSDRDPIAGVVKGSPRQISVTDLPEFLKNPEQHALHESIHLVQNNLTPEQRRAIPPDVGNPTIIKDPAYLAAQRKAGKTILQLPFEQQSYLMQYYHSLKQNFKEGYISKKEMDEYKKIYEPWSEDWEKVKLSTIEATDPNPSGFFDAARQKYFGTINTTPRAPLPPVNLQQSNVQFPTGEGATVPITDPNLAKPVDWMQKGHSYAADAGAEKPVTSPRPSKQNKPVVDKGQAERQRFEHQIITPGVPVKKEQHFAPTNLEDEKKPEGGDTKEARDLRQLLIQKRIEDVQNPAYKNPLAFTHPLDRQAATYAKAQRIIKNPHFAALPDDKKASILSNYYDKYVVPVYQNSKIEPPHKDAWISQVQKGFFKVSDFYEYSGATNKDALSDFSSTVAHAQASAVQLGGHIGHAILMAGVKTDRKILGLANFFPGSALHSWAESQADFDARIAEPALKLSQDVIDRPTFWLDTHPTRTFSEKAGSLVGEAVVQLPLYETIAAPLGALGKVVSGAGQIGKAANFTRRLATSKAGQFAGRRLAEAASSYIGDIFSETPQGDRAADMMAFMGLGIGIEGLGALSKPISRAAMKKVVATNAAIGGKVLHETIADQAAFELEHNIIGTDAAGNPIVHEPTDTKENFSAKMQAAADADPVKHSMVTAEKISQNAMARQLYDKPLNQLSKLQRRNVRVALARMTSEAVTEIPIHVPEVAKHEVETRLAEDYKDNPELAENAAYLERKYGAKIVDSVVKTEQDSIAVENGVISTQGATERVGRNEELLAKKNAELGGAGKAKTKAPRTKEDEVFNELSDSGNVKYNHRDESFDLTFASKADKNLYRVSSEPQRFGGPETKARLASHDNSMRKLRNYFPGKSDAEIKKMAADVKSQITAKITERRNDPKWKANEHPEQNTIKLDRMHDAKTATAKTKAEATKEDLPRSYVSFRTNMQANFVNPFADKAKAANKQLASFLQDMDDKEFVQEISDQMGNNIHFEKPYDMMLWGLHHAEHMPTPITKKIKEILLDQSPGSTLQELKEEGKRLSYHIDLLAMSGRLDTEGNVFRSTVTSSFTGRTKWQLQLEKEVSLGEIENYKNSMGPYKKNFSEIYDAGLKELAKMQKLRRASTSDEDYFKSYAKIKKILEDAEGGK